MEDLPPPPPQQQQEQQQQQQEQKQKQEKEQQEKVAQENSQPQPQPQQQKQKKRRYEEATTGEKYDLYLHATKHPYLRQRELADWFEATFNKSINQSTVSRALKKYKIPTPPEESGAAAPPPSKKQAKNKPETEKTKPDVEPSSSSCVPLKPLFQRKPSQKPSADTPAPPKGEPSWEILTPNNPVSSSSQQQQEVRPANSKLPVAAAPQNENISPPQSPLSQQIKHRSPSSPTFVLQKSEEDLFDEAIYNWYRALTIGGVIITPEDIMNEARKTKPQMEFTEQWVQGWRERWGIDKREEDEAEEKRRRKEIRRLRKDIEKREIQMAKARIRKEASIKRLEELERGSGMTVTAAAERA